ncbi:MAG: heme-binding protein [Cyclobacteriaceae bacterium]
MFGLKFEMFILSLLTCFSFVSNGQKVKLKTKPVLTLEVAKAISNTASEYALKNGWDVVITIVDDGGHMVYLERMDDVQTASLEVAIQKAETAAAFKRKTKAFLDALKNGRTELIALPGGMPFEGGVPLIWNDQVIGAIGVSGMTTGEQDGLIAEYGANSLQKILD